MIHETTGDNRRRPLFPVVFKIRPCTGYPLGDTPWRIIAKDFCRFEQLNRMIGSFGKIQHFFCFISCHRHLSLLPQITDFQGLLPWSKSPEVAEPRWRIGCTIEYEEPLFIFSDEALRIAQNGNTKRGERGYAPLQGIAHFEISQVSSERSLCSAANDLGIQGWKRMSAHTKLLDARISS